MRCIDVASSASVAACVIALAPRTPRVSVSGARTRLRRGACRNRSQTKSAIAHSSSSSAVPAATKKHSRRQMPPPSRAASRILCALRLHACCLVDSLRPAWFRSSRVAQALFARGTIARAAALFPIMSSTVNHRNRDTPLSLPSTLQCSRPAPASPLSFASASLPQWSFLSTSWRLPSTRRTRPSAPASSRKTILSISAKTSDCYAMLVVAET